MATTSPNANAKATVNNDKDAADHEIFTIESHLNVPIKDDSHDTVAKPLFSEDVDEGWVLVN